MAILKDTIVQGDLSVTGKIGGTFKNIKIVDSSDVEETTIVAGATDDTVIFKEGSGISLTGDASNDKLTISANTASTTAAGIVKLQDLISTATDTAVTPNAVKVELDKKANSSHGNHVPAIETANNKKFLRNDNTWQEVTPANIGAAAASHTSDTTVHITSTERSKWNSAKNHADSAHNYLSNSTKYAGSASAGGAANSVANSLKIRVNGATTEEADGQVTEGASGCITYDGSGTKIVDVAPAYGHGTIVPSTLTNGKLFFLHD